MKGDTKLGSFLEGPCPSKGIAQCDTAMSPRTTVT